MTIRIVTWFLIVSVVAIFSGAGELSASTIHSRAAKCLEDSINFWEDEKDMIYKERKIGIERRRAEASLELEQLDRNMELKLQQLATLDPGLAWEMRNQHNEDMADTRDSVRQAYERDMEELESYIEEKVDGTIKSQKKVLRDLRRESLLIACNFYRWGEECTAACIEYNYVTMQIWIRDRAKEKIELMSDCNFVARHGNIPPECSDLDK